MVRKYVSIIIVVILFTTIVMPWNTASVYAREPDAYYVSPDGDDDNPGTFEEPFRTIEKARDTVRTVIANGMTSDISVILRNGIYYIDSTLTFDESDSGRDGYHVIYKSFPGEEAVLDGGKRITNWELYQGNIYKAKVGEGTTEVPEQLGDELLVNNGFEDGMNAWTVEKVSPADPLDISEISTAEAKSGSGSLHIKETDASGNYGGMDTFQWINVDITKTYRFTFWAKYKNGDPGFRIMQANASGQQVAFNGFQLNKTENDWKMYTGTIGPANSGADFVWNENTEKIRFELRNFPQGSTTYRTVVGEAYYDNVSFKEIFFEGDRIYDGMDFNTLYENGERSYKARYPSMGSDGRNIYNYTTGGGSTTQFQFADGDIPQIADASQLQVYLFPGTNWDSGIFNVNNLNYTNHTITLASPAKRSIYANPESRYIVQGAKELLDQPGEFYLDKNDGTLYYWPRSTPIDEQVIEVPQLKTVLEVKGSSIETPVHEIVFEGMDIKNTDLLEEYYFSNDQNVNRQNMISAVLLENTRNTVIKNCKISNIGMNGILMNGLSQYNEISGNRINDIGGTGIRLEGPGKDVAGIIDLENLTSESIHHDNIISNNDITGVGRFNVYYGFGVIIFGSGNNEISHNRISNTPRGAIELLNYWVDTLNSVAGDGTVITRDNIEIYAHCRENRVEFNDISDAITEAGDAGAIYAHMTGTGNIINNNRIHDTSGYALKNLNDIYGIYLDGSTDGFTIENNIFDHLNNNGTDAPLCAIFDNGGNPGGLGDNVMNNNFITDNPDIKAALQIYRAPGISVDVRHNILYNPGKMIYSFSGWNPDMIETIDNNVFFNNTDNYRIEGVPGASTLDEWRQIEGSIYDQDSIAASPGFVNEDGLDYRLSYDTGVYALGVEDINMKDIGLTGDFKFADSGDLLDRIYVFTGQSGNKSWMNIAQDQQISLEVTGRSAEGYAVDLSNAVVQYESDNTSVAEINEQGVITACSPGVARITATVQKDGRLKSSTFDVLVDVDFAVRIQVVEQNGTDLEHIISQGLGSFYDQDTSSVIYTSDNESIAAVNEDGIVNGVIPGRANILACVTTDGIMKKVNIQVNVLENTLDKVNVTSAEALSVGISSQLQVAGMMLDGTTADLEGADISFGSGDPAIATVDNNGMVTVQDYGNVSIYADVTLDGVTRTGTLEIMNINAFEQIDAVKYDDMAYPLKDGGSYIWNTCSGGWVRYNNVDFGSGASEFDIYIGVNDNWAGGRVEARLDAPDGNLVGTLVVQSTGSFNTYQEQSTTVENASGVHDLYLVFPDKAGGSSGNFAWFKFISIPD